MHAQRCLRDIFAIEGFWKSCPELQCSPIFHPFGGTVWFFHFPHSRSFFLFSSPGSSPFLHDGYSSTSSNGRIFVLKQVRRKGKGKRVLFFLFFFFFFSIPFIRLIQVFGRNDLFQSIQSVPILFFSTCNHAVENPLSRTLDPDGRMDGGWNAISGDPFPFQV